MWSNKTISRSKVRCLKIRELFPQNHSSLNSSFTSLLEIGCSCQTPQFWWRRALKCILRHVASKVHLVECCFPKRWSNQFLKRVLCLLYTIVECEWVFGTSPPSTCISLAGLIVKNWWVKISNIVLCLAQSRSQKWSCLPPQSPKLTSGSFTFPAIPALYAIAWLDSPWHRWFSRLPGFFFFEMDCP